jgi:hypothetical protein
MKRGLKWYGLCVCGALGGACLYGCTWWQPIALAFLDYIYLPLVGKTP